MNSTPPCCSGTGTASWLRMSRSGNGYAGIAVLLEPIAMAVGNQLQAAVSIVASNSGIQRVTISVSSASGIMKALS